MDASYTWGAALRRLPVAPPCSELLEASHGTTTLRANRQAGDRDIRLYIELDMFIQAFGDFEMLLACWTVGVSDALIDVGANSWEANCLTRFHLARVTRFMDDSASEHKLVLVQAVWR